MNKLLIAAAFTGLASVAIVPSVLAQTQPPQPPAAEKTQPPMSFAETDADKSGDISFKESTAVHPSLTQEQFNMLDKDKNGTLNEDEYVALDAAPRIGQEAN